jgi:hypothetical protein
VAKSTAKDVADTAASFNPVKFLSDLGVRSDWAYIGGFASILLSLLTWLGSRGKKDDRAQSDRWGIFVGHWAPTFMGLGVALKLEENKKS